MGIFPLRIAPVLLINNQYAPRPSHLTFTPTSHLYTYISPLHLHLTFTPTSHLYTYISPLHLHLIFISTSTASRIPTTLPLLPRSSISTILPQLPRAPAYYYTAKFELWSITYYCYSIGRTQGGQDGGLRLIRDRGGTPRTSRDHGRIRRYERISPLILSHARF
jgi:hypothetical protein